MQPFSPDYFLAVQSTLRYYEAFLNQPDVPSYQNNTSGNTSTDHWVKANVITESDRKNFDGVYESAQHQFEILELTASLATIKKMRRVLATPGSTYGDFWGFGSELEGRLRDEFYGRTFFAMTLKESDYFNKSREGWEQIIARFADSAGDIEESRKCFALSRYAAAVFHSIQVIEVGLIELGTFLNVPDPKSGWTAIANTLKNVVKKSTKSSLHSSDKILPFLNRSTVL